MSETVDGEYIENFKTVSCFDCNADLGYFCLTDMYVGITMLCISCMSKRQKVKSVE